MAQPAASSPSSSPSSSPYPSPSPSSSPPLPFSHVPSASPIPYGSASPYLPSNSSSSAAAIGASIQRSPSPNSNPNSLVHIGVDLMNKNQFIEAEAFFAAHCERDSKIGLLRCYLAFIKAASSHGETDLKDALAMIWAMEKRASSQKHAPIEGKLIQADTHFLGALVQIISQKYVKAAWNLRKSLNFYSSAMKDLQTYNGADKDSLLGWCDYGNGFFNLVLSFLPPSVMKVANWTGYGGDRDGGLALLHRSQQSSSFMAPFSCLLLQTYYVSIASFTGEPEDTYLGVSEQLFQWSDAHYPDAVLFLLMKSKAWRCKKNLQQAIITAKQAIHNCKELPSVAVLFHFNTGWCSFFLLDWQQSAFYFDELLHLEPSGAYVPPAGGQKHSPEELKLIEEERASPDRKRMPPAKASALTFYATMVGLNYMLLNNSHKSRWYFSLVEGLSDKKSDKPIDLYAKRKSQEYLKASPEKLPEDALLDACELLLTWNGTSQMPDEACKKMLELLDKAEGKRLQHWKLEQSAAVFLYRAEMLKGLGDISGAQKQIQMFLSLLPQLEKSSKMKSDGTIAFGLYVSAYLLLLENNIALAAEHLKKAQKVEGYDQYNQMQVRMHALSQRIQRTKAAKGIK